MDTFVGILRQTRGHIRVQRPAEYLILRHPGPHRDPREQPAQPAASGHGLVEVTFRSKVVWSLERESWEDDAGPSRRVRGGHEEPVSRAEALQISRERGRDRLCSRDELGDAIPRAEERARAFLVDSQLAVADVRVRRPAERLGVG